MKGATALERLLYGTAGQSDAVTLANGTFGEQFTLTPGGTYWFYLSEEKIPGTVNQGTREGGWLFQTKLSIGSPLPTPGQSTPICRTKIKTIGGGESEGHIKRLPEV